MSKKIGFIGCGNMGSAILGGLIKSGFVNADEIIVSTKTESSSKRLKDEFNVLTTFDSKMVAREAKTVILAVKPLYLYI